MGDQHFGILAEQAIRCSLVMLHYNLEPCKLNLEDTRIKFIEIEMIVIRDHEGQVIFRMTAQLCRCCGFAS